MTEPSAPRPRTAFISGPIDATIEFFDQYYRDRIVEAIDNGDSFVIGPVAGIDTFALNFLLALPPFEMATTTEDTHNAALTYDIKASHASTPSSHPPAQPTALPAKASVLSNSPAETTNRPIDPSRITIHLAYFEYATSSMLSPFQSLGVNIHEEGVTTRERDASMTRMSDYDILRYRTEAEAKEIYGEMWWPRVSNTEVNERRRKGISSLAYKLEEDAQVKHNEVPETTVLHEDKRTKGTKIGLIWEKVLKR